MQSKLSRWCDGFLEAAWLAALIATPLFFNIHSERVFEPDKLTLLRSIALLMAIVWFVKFIDQQGWKDLSWLRWRSSSSIWRRPLVLPVMAVVLVYIISSLISVAPRTSLLGSYQRLQGTYTTLSYVVLFAVIASTMRTRAQLQRVITVVIITSIPVALYGILQRLELDPLPWGGDTSRRIAGHMGNSIFVGAYLIMAIPLTATRIIDSFFNILTDEDLSYADVVRSSIYLLTIVIQLIATYFTQSRGPLLGLAIGLFAFVLILLVSLRNAAAGNEKRTANSLIWPVVMLAVCVAALFLSGALISALGPSNGFYAYAGIIGIVMLAIFIFAGARIGWRWLWAAWLVVIGYVGAVVLVFNLSTINEAQFEQTPVLSTLDATFDVWREQPTISRVGDMLNSEAGTSTVRLLIWGGVLDLITPHEPIAFPNGETDSWNFLRPLFGYGPESMYVAYNRFYPPELATIEARNASPDRSHNETFDALVITGVLGFVAWQALYLATFLFAFRSLGVVKDKRDRNLLTGLWVVGAVISTAALVTIGGAVYLGIAIPFGSILGLVVYLVLYALRGERDSVGQEYDLMRLVMVGLVASLIAYYVEIHFGIAIASTRTHSFVFIALVYVLGYRLGQGEAEHSAETTKEKRADKAAATVKPSPRRARRTTAPASSGNGGPIIAAMLILTFLMMTLAYDFINFTPQQAEVQSWRSAADLPSSMEIFRRSMLVNPRDNFAASPYLYGVFVLSWLFGAAVLVSEMVRQGTIKLTRGSSMLEGSAKTIGAGLFGLLAIVGIAVFVLSGQATPVTRVDAVARLLGGLWTVLAGVAVAGLFVGGEIGRKYAGGVATVGLLFSFPLFFAGALWQCAVIGILSAVALYFVWDKSWQSYFTPMLAIGIGSYLLAGLYALVHSGLIRGSFIAPNGAGGVPLAGLERNIVEAERIGGYLTTFYSFAIALLLLAGLAFVWNTLSSYKSTGGVPGYVALVVLLLFGFFMIDQSNLNVVQADMTYKRGKPYDQQAGQLARSINQQPAEERQQTLEAAVGSWQSAVAIYERAVEMAPSEDFYYLWLGRAYLEESSINQPQQTQLLETAEQRLLRAQGINPLNTDHTANLARLNVRWAQLVGDEASSAEKIADAERHYIDALALSPQNSIIRNEYAGLALSLDQDCDKAIDIYRESIDVDPLYEQTYYRLAETYISCGQRQDPVSVEHFAEAREVLDSLFENLPERLLSRVEPRVTTLNIQIAQAYLQAGETATARDIAGAIEITDQPNVEAQVDALLQQIETVEANQIILEEEEVPEQ